MTFFFKKTLGLRSVDAGHGWLIFGVPAAEVAFHSHDENNRHEMYFMCDDIKAQVAALKKRGVQVGEVSEQKWEPSRQYRFPVEVPLVYMNRNTLSLLRGISR